MLARALETDTLINVLNLLDIVRSRGRLNEGGASLYSGQAFHDEYDGLPDGLEVLFLSAPYLLGGDVSGPNSSCLVVKIIFAAHGMVPFQSRSQQAPSAASDY